MKREVHIVKEEEAGRGKETLELKTHLQSHAGGKVKGEGAKRESGGGGVHSVGKFEMKSGEKGSAGENRRVSQEAKERAERAREEEERSRLEEISKYRAQQNSRDAIAGAQVRAKQEARLKEEEKREFEAIRAAQNQVFYCYSCLI